MRTIVPITCALCIATASRADTPPAGAPVDPAPVAAPEQPAAPSPASAAPSPAPAAPSPAPAAPSPAPAPAPARSPAAAPSAEPPAAPPRSRSRIPEIVATIVTGGLVVATAASYREWDQAQDRRRAAQWDPTVTVEEHNRNIEDTGLWKKRTWLLIGATFASAAITTFTWMRNQDPSSFSVQPTDDGDGAAVSYSGRF